MPFTHSDLGQRQAGDVVDVTLQGNAASVRLLDSNFSSGWNGRPHRYAGGLAKKSLVRLRISHAGHWHVAVDLHQCAAP